jgi:hypothetical protein
MGSAPVSRTKACSLIVLAGFSMHKKNGDPKATDPRQLESHRSDNGEGGECRYH